MAKKIELLKKSALFSDLADHELEVIARYSRYCHYGPGEKIFDEESHGEEFFIIKKGEVLITKHRGDDNIDIARFIWGETFGEFELLDEAPRSVVATAEQDTTLLVFPGKGIYLKDILEKHPQIFARVLHRLLIMIAGRIRSSNRLISEKTPWVQDLRRQLFSDRLTGLYNRTYMEEDFSELLPKYGVGTSLIMIKPDNFKQINDRFGHQVGDRVLQLLADRVKSVIGDGAAAARYRGDEFAAILPGVNIKVAVQTAENIRAAIKRMGLGHLIDGRIDAITVSIGVAAYPQHGSDNLALIQSAFEMMFKARKSGGDCIFCAHDVLSSGGSDE